MPFDNLPITAKILTWRDVLDCLKHDPGYPAHRRAYDLSRVRKALAWDAAPSWQAARSMVRRASQFEGRPFNRQTIAELFDGLRGPDLRLAQKTLDNARSVCVRVADHYELPRGIADTPLSNDTKRLLALVASKWDRAALMRGMRYLSYVGTSPWDMTDAIAHDFATALVEQFRVVEPRRIFNHFTRVWNKCTRVAEFPQVVLTRRVRPPRPSIDWTDYTELEATVDAYLAKGYSTSKDDAGEDIDQCGLDADAEDEVLQPLSPKTIASNKKNLRMVVWALSPERLVELRDLCMPRRYQQAMRKLTERAGGVVNRTVMARAETLLRVAKHPGVLSAGELKSVRALYGNYVRRHAKFLETHDDRDQRTLEQLDDPSVMDAFLALPTLVKNRVLQMRNRRTLACAYAIQRALILELWFCAPYRIGAYVGIELDQFVSIRLDTVDRTLLRGPRQQPKNKTSPEHFLNDASIDLLRLYLEDYRDIILRANKWANSPYLLPGRSGKCKAPRSLHDQMTRFVRKHTKLKEWHPHLMRKVVPKIALDADPGALEIVRRTGGWKSDRMLQTTYGQRQHRASQARFLELLESRRLSGLLGLASHRRRRSKGMR